MLNSNIVSQQWLLEHLNDERLIILDATMKKMPNGQPIPEPESKILGAVAFNFDTEICDQNSPLPHMLPSPSEFEAACRKIGVTKNSIVVCYDAMGVFSSPRAWWMFKVFGHQNVFVLNGGLPLWLKEERPTAQTYRVVKDHQNTFKANFNHKMVYTREQVLASLESDSIQVVDARAFARFYGEEAEPRPNLKGGHIPNASCLPFDQLIENFQFLSKSQLAKKFKDLINPNQQGIVFSCGSGVTACVLALAADELGFQNISVYDGSWAEWGASKDLPIETGH